MKALLGWDKLNPNKSTESGETLLGWAARNWHEGVMKMLLGIDEANPGKSDIYGQTLLWWPARCGLVGAGGLLQPRHLSF